ncbi:alpha- and gamma-adaptin-binding protein p34-like [Mizuhopecten yessoensis]|uniref:alpha- and gamma-adaptin-binding protein p34-like n=1 Tax=Mizuhopecten yessoensis TaxID=6573 RepID=UPI000B45D5E4|nr:alpha- and gamma-adaptin-binding protein p34-like [Mizuhopecten yessoensis]
MSSFALFTSCCSEFPSGELIRQILNVDDLPSADPLIENIFGYDWHVDTKYYTAETKLCCTSRRTIGDESFAENVHAFIVYFNAEESKTFDLAKSWLPYLKQIKPAVQILVCKSCSENTCVKKVTAQEWCIDNNFELVELCPLEESDCEDDFQETTGTKRIIQALHAYTWPDLIMKERPSFRSPYMTELMKEESSRKSHESEKPLDRDAEEPNNRLGDTAVNGELEGLGCNGVVSGTTDLCSGDTPAAATGKSKKTSVNVIDSMLPFEDAALFEAVGADDPGGESFEKLFANFRLMKEKAESLPLEERKIYAEQVATSFWQAIGGEDSDEDT